MKENHVRVKFLRPLKWGGEVRQSGYTAALPVDVARSLLRHRAVELAEDAGRTPGEHPEAAKPAATPKRDNVGTKQRKGTK